MSQDSNWSEALENPSTGFFDVCAAVFREAGENAAVLEAVKYLVPRIDWAFYLPLFPNDLSGLWSVLKLKPLLAPKDFRTILALQLYALAKKKRAAEQEFSEQEFSGQGLNSLEKLAANAMSDMSCLGHKMVAAHRLECLHKALDGDEVLGKLFTDLASQLFHSEPKDFYWNQRAGVRLGSSAAVKNAAALLDDASIDAMVDEIRNLGLVALLDAWASHIQCGLVSGDFLEVLTLAAADKMLDSRKDMEYKTSWLLVHLAAFAKVVPVDGGNACAYLTEAALVNLFPSNEPEEKISPRAPESGNAESDVNLLEAILDGEARGALHFCQQMIPEKILPVLAEATCSNDPALNNSHQLLVVASATEILPLIRPRTAARICSALAKCLANTQGATDMVLKAKLVSRL